MPLIQIHSFAICVIFIPLDMHAHHRMVSNACMRIGVNSAPSAYNTWALLMLKIRFRALMITFIASVACDAPY